MDWTFNLETGSDAGRFGTLPVPTRTLGRDMAAYGLLLHLVRTVLWIDFALRLLPAGERCNVPRAR